MRVRGLVAATRRFPSVPAAQHSTGAGAARPRCHQLGVASVVASGAPTALAAASRSHGLVVSAHRFLLTHQPRRGGMYGRPHPSIYLSIYLYSRLLVAHLPNVRIDPTKQNGQTRTFQSESVDYCPSSAITK